MSVGIVSQGLQTCKLVEYGHAGLDKIVRYTDAKAECRQVCVSRSDGAQLPQSSGRCLCYRLDRLDEGVRGVDSDWRHRDAAHRHAEILSFGDTDQPVIIQRR